MVSRTTKWLLTAGFPALGGNQYQHSKTEILPVVQTTKPLQIRDLTLKGVLRELVNTSMRFNKKT